MREDFYNFIKNYVEENYSVEEIKNLEELENIIDEANKALIDNAFDIANEISNQIENEYTEKLKLKKEENEEATLMNKLRMGRLW